MKTNTGIIYKAISPSGKVYIGQTTDILTNRARKHANDAKKYTYAFANAIRKYGINSFAWIIIHKDIPECELNSIEIYEIQEHNSFCYGYNSTKGGDFNPMEYEINRKKVSERTKGVKHNIDQSGEKNHRAVLNWNIVHKIREEYRVSNLTHLDLAKKYDVARKTISNVINNTCWHDKEYIIPSRNKKDKLSQKIANDIRIMYKSKKLTYKDLAIKYNVCFQTIGLIITNKIWCQNEKS